MSAAASPIINIDVLKKRVHAANPRLANMAFLLDCNEGCVRVIASIIHPRYGPTYCVSGLNGFASTLVNPVHANIAAKALKKLSRHRTDIKTAMWISGGLETVIDHFLSEGKIYSCKGLLGRDPLEFQLAFTAPVALPHPGLPKSAGDRFFSLVPEEYGQDFVAAPVRRSPVPLLAYAL